MFASNVTENVFARVCVCLAIVLQFVVLCVYTKCVQRMLNQNQRMAYSFGNARAARHTMRCLTPVHTPLIYSFTTHLPYKIQPDRTRTVKLNVDIFYYIYLPYNIRYNTIIRYYMQNVHDIERWPVCIVNLFLFVVHKIYRASVQCVQSALYACSSVQWWNVEWRA